MRKSLQELIVEIKNKLEGLGASNDKTKRYIRELDELSGLLKNTKLKDELTNEYNMLIDKALELNQDENYRNIKKMEKFIPRCFRLYYDNSGELGEIMKKLVYTYIGTSILFFIVSFPTYISVPFLPIIFIAPMYVGIKGIQKTSSRSLTIGMTLIEFSVLTGIIGLFNVFFATKFNIIIVLYALVSIGLMAMAGYNIYYYRKYKKLFS